MLLNIVVQSLVQVLVFAAVPFVCWLIAARRNETFWAWLGLYRPRGSSPGRILALCAGVAVLLLLPGLYLTLTFPDRSMLAGAKFAGSGGRGLVAILVYAGVQTGLSEELLFRGFLLKRVFGRLGAGANLLQALLFGLIHGGMLFAVLPPVQTILVILFTGLAGWLMGRINEAEAGGSILPGWAIHAVTNAVSALLFWLGIVPV